MGIFGWDLPPGVTPQMIDDAFGDDVSNEPDEPDEPAPALCEGCGLSFPADSIFQCGCGMELCRSCETDHWRAGTPW